MLGFGQGGFSQEVLCNQFKCSFFSEICLSISLLSDRPVVDVKTVVQILLEVGLLLAGTIIFQCVTVAINNVTKVCFVLCVGERTDSSLMLPWCSVSLVRSGSMQAVITLIRKNIKSIMPRNFHTSVQTASQRRDPYSCW